MAIKPGGLFGLSVQPYFPDKEDAPNWEDDMTNLNRSGSGSGALGYALGRGGRTLFDKFKNRNKPRSMSPEEVARNTDQAMTDLMSRYLELDPNLTPQEAAQKAAREISVQSLQYGDPVTRQAAQTSVISALANVNKLPGPESDSTKTYAPMPKVWVNGKGEKRVVNQRDMAELKAARDEGFMPDENEKYMWGDHPSKPDTLQAYTVAGETIQPVPGLTRSKVQKVVTGTPQDWAGGLESKGKRDDEAIEITNKSIGLKNFIDTSKKIEELTAAAPTALHTAGAISKFADNVRATVSSLVTAYGGTIEEIDPNRFSESTLAAIDRSNFGSAMKKAGMDAARIRALFIDLAYASAQEREPGGRGFNEQDLQRALATVGADITSPEAAIQVLRDGREMAIGKYMNYMRMKQVGDKPAIDDPRFQNQLNLVNRSRWPKADPVGTIVNGRKYIGGNPRDPLSWVEVK